MKKLTNKQRHEMASSLAEGSTDAIELKDLVAFYEDSMYRTFDAMTDKKLQEAYEDRNG